MTFALYLAPFLLANSGEVSPQQDPAVAQEAPAPQATASARTASNVVFAEALGSGLLYSVNYERLVDSWNVGLRAGVSYFSHAVSSYGASGNLKLLTVPFVASYYIGTPRHKVQLGLGATILYLAASTDSQGNKFGGDRSGAGVAASGVVGYRYLPPNGGISFGAAFTPLLRSGSFLPWGGANVGYVF